MEARVRVRPTWRSPQLAHALPPPCPRARSWASPLLLALDLRTAPASARAALQNREVLAIAADPLGRPARCLDEPCTAPQPSPSGPGGGLQRWHRQLAHGRHCVVLFNGEDGVPGTPLPVRVRWAELLAPEASANSSAERGKRRPAPAHTAGGGAPVFAVRDVLRHETLSAGVVGGVEVRVSPSSARMLVLTPVAVGGLAASE